MTGSPKETTPLGCLAFFIVGVSVLGSILAGAHYFAIDLPKQQPITLPENGASEMIEFQERCKGDCYNAYNPSCYDACNGLIPLKKMRCNDACNAALNNCYEGCYASSALYI